MISSQVSLHLFAVGPIPGACRTVSEVERLRLGRSSGGNTAGLELVETAVWRRLLRERKDWILEHGWICKCPGACSGDFYLLVCTPACERVKVRRL